MLDSVFGTRKEGTAAGIANRRLFCISVGSRKPDHNLATQFARKMADLSLDDFIRKNNVKVKINNPQQGITTQKLGTQRRTQGIRPPPKGFDARKRLGPKKPLTDARDKIIINKKSGGGDARNKIVQKQVQKGTFDARSLLQRQANKPQSRGKQLPGKLANTGAGLSLKRTLSNPNAHGQPQVRVTGGGLTVTKPVSNTQVSMYGSTLQVTKRTKPFEGVVPNAVPIIQIRNDRYRQPAHQPPSTSQSQYYSHPPSRQSSYPDYDLTGYPYSDTAQSHQTRGYRDLDDPQYNAASIATPEIPKIHISNVRPVEAVSMRPVTYAGDYSHTRAPPGAATLSQPMKQPMAKPVLAPSKLTPAGVKRRQPQQEVSGPLRLGKGGGPGLDLALTDTSPSKKSRLAPAAGDAALMDEDDGADVISPLQGFRVMVTNLFSGVTQDDIIELFGAVGPLKKAKLLKPGSAEVVYVSKNDAVSAVQKYHSRELDGQPMYVKMTTPSAAVVKKVLEHDPDITGEALRLYKKGTGIGALPEAPVEIPTIHRALFKAGPPGPNKSVKFTVKI